jgi:hypothetical protein
VFQAYGCDVVRVSNTHFPCRHSGKGYSHLAIDQKSGVVMAVTVMVCDMEGFTPLVEQLGPETAYSIMDKVYEILIHFGGKVLIVKQKRPFLSDRGYFESKLRPSSINSQL